MSTSPCRLSPFCGVPARVVTGKDAVGPIPARQEADPWSGARVPSGPNVLSEGGGIRRPRADAHARKAEPGGDSYDPAPDWRFRRSRTAFRRQSEQHSGVKSNSIPEARRTRFRAEVEQQSERSDAGVLIVEQVLGFVKKPRTRLPSPERSGGRMAPAGKGFGERGAASFPVQHVATPAELYPAGSAPPRFFRIDSPRISSRVALCTIRSRIPSATVGSPICSCHLLTGICEVRIIDLA